MLFEDHVGYSQLICGSDTFANLANFLFFHSTIFCVFLKIVNLKWCTLLDFRENVDNFQAQTERVNFGLFLLNYDFTWPYLTSFLSLQLSPNKYESEILLLSYSYLLLFWDIEKSVPDFDQILQCVMSVNDPTWCTWYQFSCLCHYCSIRIFETIFCFVTSALVT